MAARKFAISVPEEVLHEVDRAAKRRGMTRSGFITNVLSQVARARTDAEIARRVNDLFSDREIAREQVETAKQFRRIAPRRGAEW
jgi:metal-responsive CopG/Arc/MetJ family transcriptional regulator